MSEVPIRRVIELITLLGNDNLIPGPLDREDLRNLLCEVFEQREIPAQVPTLRAAS